MKNDLFGSHTPVRKSDTTKQFEAELAERKRRALRSSRLSDIEQCAIPGCGRDGPFGFNGFSPPRPGLEPINSCREHLAEVREIAREALEKAESTTR